MDINNLILQLENTFIKSKEERVYELQHQSFQHIKSRRQRKKMNRKKRKMIKKLNIQIRMENEKPKKYTDINTLVTSLHKMGF